MFLKFLKKLPNTPADIYETCQKNWREACSAMSLRRLVQNIVGSLYLVAEPWTMSCLRGRFKFRKYMGPPSYINTLVTLKCFHVKFTSSLAWVFNVVFSFSNGHLVIIFIYNAVRGILSDTGQTLSTELMQEKSCFKFYVLHLCGKPKSLFWINSGAKSFFHKDLLPSTFLGLCGCKWGSCSSGM